MDRKEWKNKWAAENPDAYRKYQREYRQKRRLEDAEFRQRIAKHTFNNVLKDNPLAEFIWTEHIPEKILDKFKSQNNCEICGINFGPDTPKCLDHDHFTKIARGALCKKCNMGLGYFQDDVENLRNAIRYIEKSDSI